MATNKYKFALGCYFSKTLIKRSNSNFSWAILVWRMRKKSITTIAIFSDAAMNLKKKDAAEPCMCTTANTYPVVHALQYLFSIFPRCVGEGFFCMELVRNFFD